MPKKRKPIILQVPRRIGNKPQGVTTKFGPLTMQRPKVVDGKLLAGKVILVKRGFSAFDQGDGTVATVNDNVLEIRYEDEWVRYRLYPEPLVWSDGPPHPISWQLAVRTGRTDGVEDPPQVVGEVASPVVHKEV